MGYAQRKGLGYLIRGSSAHDTAEDASASPAVYGGYLVTKPCTISEFKFMVTDACVADTTAPVVEVNRRPTPGSGTGEVLIAQLTIPNGTAAGKVLSKRFSPVQLHVGDELSLELVTQAVDSGTAACEGFYDAVLEMDEESDGNESDLVASS